MSQDTFRLMEIVNNLVAKIYERDRHQNTEINKYVTWKHVCTVNQFPSMLMGQNNANFLFSPNFDRYIDVIYSRRQFCVRNVIFEKNAGTHSDDKKNRKLIPTDIISFDGFGDKDPKTIVKYLASRIMFVNDDYIRVLNEEGLDFLLCSRRFTLKAYTKIDN